MEEINYEAKQTAEDIKDILTPPNWKNRNIDEEYTNLISKYAGIYDKITNESALFKFIQKEDAIKTSNIFTGIAENTGMHLFINHENTILDIHGRKSGKIYYKGFDFKINEIVDRLEEAGLIPEGTKQIYTMSCYGGLQEKGLSASGIPFESIHTAKDKVDITDANKIKEKLEKYKQEIEHSKDEQIIKQYKNLKDHEDIIALKVDKADPYGKINEKFKINTLTQYEKYGEHFADTKLVDQEAIDKALWPKLKEKIQDKINSFENNDDPLKALYKQWYKRLEEKYKPQYLTAQEAFDKYGPNDDRFYTSQGLDPIEQKQKINKLNNTNKLSNQEILDHVHEQTQDAERQFIRTANDLERNIQEANQLRDQIEQNLKELEQEELEEIKIINQKPEIKIDSKETLEETAKETIKETAEETVEKTQLTAKTIQNTAKNALNTKGLGIAIAVGATAAIAGIAGIIAGSHKKDNDKNEKENKKQTKNDKEYAINTAQYSQMDYNNNLAYANQITNFSRGHSTYSLG